MINSSSNSNSNISNSNDNISNNNDNDNDNDNSNDHDDTPRWSCARRSPPTLSGTRSGPIRTQGMGS